MAESDNTEAIGWKDRLGHELGIRFLKREHLSLIRIIISSFVMFLPILLISAPFLEPPGTVYLGEDGRANTIEHWSQINAMHNPVSKAAYLFGDWECHQHASRSFFLHGNQMPVCSRCTAIFLFMGITAIFLLFYRVRISLLWAMILIVPMGLDGTVQMLTSYESTNLIRFVTGSLAGIASVLAFDTIFEM